MNPIKVFLSIFTVGIIVTIALGFIGEPEQDTAEQEPTEQEPTAEVAVEDFVKQSCITCHGADLQGGVGPALVGTALSKEEIVEVLKNGLPGGMPPGLASGKEDEVAAYILSLE